ncbi:hypothetical protein F5Y07DRAFT_348418 [Xylaria sp. FL0933]|nr:hypothetical protein F5Y07DRAFT_348418 [Xylaria sp. FL0933]
MASHSNTHQTVAQDDRSNPVLLPLPRLLRRLPHNPKRARVSGFKPRKGTARVRTGCIVCKIRRIKCDEQKPYCRRCTSTGRKCEYNDAGPCQSKGWGYSRAVPVPLSMRNPSFESQDKQLPYIFRLTAENELSRRFEPFCWTHLVLQLARIYPGVHHSICAVGALQRAYLHGEHHLHFSQEVLDLASTPLVLARYNMAVKSVTENLCQKTVSPQPILVCCALFTWLEFLRNNFETGLKHLRSGLEIIRDWSQEPKGTGSWGNLPTQRVDESILRLFMRLQTHVAAHGHPFTEFHSAGPVTSSLSLAPSANRNLNISEARCLLDDILLKVFRFVRHKQFIERSTAELTKLLQSRDTLLADLSQWQALFTSSFNTAPSSERGDCGILLLSSYHLMASIILNTLLAESETAYDNYFHEFSKLVSMSQRILRSTTGSAPFILMTLDVGVIPLLFFTCLKCRHTSIRSQALSLLRLCPEREGMWHRDSILAASTLKIALESNIGTSVYGERVVDALNASQTARVQVFNEVKKETMVIEVPGLMSRLGDLL